MPDSSAESGAIIKTETHSANERLLYLAHLVTSGYGKTVSDDRVPTLDKANLVGSKTESGCHQPAIDVDIPVVAIHTDSGDEVWVDTKMRKHAYSRLLKCLSGLGMLTSSPKTSRRLTARNQAYETVRGQAIDRSNQLEVIEALGPEATFGFNALLKVAARTASPKIDTGPPLEDPWCLPLKCGVVLLPSTSNHHLFLDAELSWDEYARLLKALVKAHIVERGYFRASRVHHESHLRLPWVKKDAALVPPKWSF